MLADQGNVRFELDPTNGLVRVTVRPPLGLETSAVSAVTSVLDVLDFAANATLFLNKAQRAIVAQLANGATVRTPT